MSSVINKIRKNGLDYEIQDLNALSVNTQELTDEKKEQALKNLGITANSSEISKLSGLTVNAQDINTVINKMDLPENPTDGQFISYNASSRKWENIDAPDASGGDTFKLVLNGGSAWVRDPIVVATYLDNKMAVTVNADTLVTKAGFAHYDENLLTGQGIGSYTLVRNGSTNTFDCAGLSINGVGASSLSQYGLTLENPDNCVAGDTITVTVNWSLPYQIKTDAQKIINVGFGYIFSSDTISSGVYNDCEIYASTISGNSVRFDAKKVSVNNINVNCMKIVLSNSTADATIYNATTGTIRSPRVIISEEEPKTGEIQSGDFWYKIIP